jgi:S-adenosylmethionine-dependent methyltransferase
MAKEILSQDRNFDDLAKRFKRNVYGSLKGDIRLAILQRDCRAFLSHVKPFCEEGAHLTNKPWLILDAGGGQGQFSLDLAEAGHQVVICDISQEMLALAKEAVTARGLSQKVLLLHCSLQDVSTHLETTAFAGLKFDLVICHAVMEWLQFPDTLLPILTSCIKPEGYLSLTFYNVNSLIYKNLLRTNYKKILEEDYHGYRGSLTPINPLDPQRVLEWVANLPLSILAYSGIRVFYDYILEPEDRKREPESVLELELRLSQQEPFRSLGRYQHLLMKRL